MPGKNHVLRDRHWEATKTLYISEEGALVAAGGTGGGAEAVSMASSHRQTRSSKKGRPCTELLGQGVAGRRERAGTGEGPGRIRAVPQTLGRGLRVGLVLGPKSKGGGSMSPWTEARGRPRLFLARSPCPPPLPRGLPPPPQPSRGPPVPSLLERRTPKPSPTSPASARP